MYDKIHYNKKKKMQASSTYLPTETISFKKGVAASFRRRPFERCCNEKMSPQRIALCQAMSVYVTITFL